MIRSFFLHSFGFMVEIMAKIKPSYVMLCIMLIVFQTSSAQIIPEGIYVIKSSIDPNHAIDLRSSEIYDGNNIHIWSVNGTNAQRWKVTHSNGAIVLRSIINENYVIDLNHSNAVRGENIHLWLYNGSNAQRWIPQYVNGGFVLKSAVNPNYVLDLSGSNTGDGNNIQCWDDNGTNAQKWIFSEVGSQQSIPGYNGKGFTLENSSINGVPATMLGGNTYSSGSSTSYSNSSSGRRCEHCNGNGRCHTCNGNYTRWVGYVGAKPSKCPNCSNGTCPYCGGTGRR